jgi:hypothetical protein
MTSRLALVALAVFLSACPPGPKAKPRQWYPIDRCHDYAAALRPARAKCLGCAGAKCDVGLDSSWNNSVQIHRLDCSGRVCLAQ